MAQEAVTRPATGAAFREGHVEADGFRIRYAEAGEGTGAGAPSRRRRHAAERRQDLLAQQHRVIVFEMPGSAGSAENSRTQSMPDYAATMVRAADALGLDRFNLWGTSFGGKVALWLAVQHPERLQALVLEAPAAIRPAGARAPSGSPGDMARALYGHPERMPPLPATDPAVQAKQQALTGRLRGPDRDPELEAGMRVLQTPTLVLFGTLDRVIPPEMGRHYKELMPGNSHLALVYDAGHAIAAERPEAFTEIVADFLDRHTAFLISRTETLIHP